MIPLIEVGTAACARYLGRLGRRQEKVDRDTEGSVRRILAAVERGGDAALVEMTRRFDGVHLDQSKLTVPAAELHAARARLPRTVRTDLERAARRVADFHRRQIERSWRYRDRLGVVLGQRIDPVGRVGVYIPGGGATYASTVLMTVIPAKVAGVPEVVGVSPPATRGGSQDAVLAAAAIAGLDRLYRVGGAQAIAALAYGTATIPRVDKIVGPGNRFVQVAKRLVSGQVGVDLFAGPTEMVVVADGTARADLVAADMLAQAEHDPLAAALCITPSRSLAAALRRELARQLSGLPKRAVAARALRSHGAVVVTRHLGAAIDLAARIAPEHLQLAVRRPDLWLGKVRNAGAIFLGQISPEPFGDYLAGPNHVLPTGGTARFASPLGVYDFVKRTSIIGMSPRGLQALGRRVVRLAKLEGLEGHGRAVERRLGG